MPLTMPWPNHAFGAAVNHYGVTSSGGVRQWQAAPSRTVDAITRPSIPVCAQFQVAGPRGSRSG
ncbi:MAG: hypothetical protein JWR48_1602 [Mycobacterium sp.]|nr:hypothetical protein [Mycobacterium sp.]